MSLMGENTEFSSFLLDQQKSQELHGGSASSSNIATTHQPLSEKTILINSSFLYLLVKERIAILTSITTLRLVFVGGQTLSEDKGFFEITVYWNLQFHSSSAAGNKVSRIFLDL